MPFPAINYCLVCEGFRQEMGGKFSVLGFFGVVPNVDIGLGRLDQPLALTLLLGFGAVDDASQTYNHSVIILNPDGSVLFQTPQAKINTLSGKPGVLIAVGAGIPKMSGLRTIKVVINGETWFEKQFMIRQATPQELAGLPGAPIH